MGFGRVEMGDLILCFFGGMGGGGGSVDIIIINGTGEEEAHRIRNVEKYDDIITRSSDELLGLLAPLQINR